MLSIPLRSAGALLALVLVACSDPPDETPLGREAAALLARPEQDVPKVTLQHVLLAFVNAKRGSKSKHTFEEARALTSDVLARARAGEDFTAPYHRVKSPFGWHVIKRLE